MRRRFSITMRGLALAMALVAFVGIKPAGAAPADVFSIGAPTIGSAPPKASALSDGDASISSQTGAYKYGYPIGVPPGRHGMEPSLALSYTSQGPIYGGIATGWSLSIPIIEADTSKGRLLNNGAKIYSSSMGGGRPFVLSGEPLQDNVTATYRVSQNDATFTRYELMDHAQSGFWWRVLTPDGHVSLFGQSDHIGDCAIVSDGYAPLTTETDEFGNAVEYFYGAGVSGECRINQITWGQNTHPGVAASFASVRFAYAYTPPSCSGIPIGSQTSYRTGVKIVTGASELDSINVTAYLPGIPSVPVHQRTISLSYSGTNPGADCNGEHSAFRSLASIQESAWGTDSPLVTLPPVTFTYGSAVLEWPAETTHTLPWTPTDYGNGNNGHSGFNLGWGYRFNSSKWPTVEAMMIDIDGDGLIDRLTVDPVWTSDNAHVKGCGASWERNEGNLHFGPRQHIFMPTLKWASPDPSKPFDGGAYAVENTSQGANESCSLNYQQTGYYNTTPALLVGKPCPLDGDGNGSCPASGYCSNGDDCNKTGAPHDTVLSFRWIDMDGDGLVDLVASPVQGGLVNYNFQHGSGISGHVNDVPNEPNIFGNFPLPCPSVRVTIDPSGAYTMCGGMYPWIVYKNLGNGAFGNVVGGQTFPTTILYQPMALETDTGDTSITSLPVGQYGGIEDIDGDGYSDAVFGGQGTYWFVYHNDGTGQFKPALADPLFVFPFLMSTPQPDMLSYSNTIDYGPTSVVNLQGQLDLNGDGLQDHWSSTGSGATFDINDGENLGAVATATTSLRPGTDGLANVVSYAAINSPYIAQGSRADSSRTIDLDGDGRVDLVQFQSGSTLPITHFNQGGDFAGIGAFVGDAFALLHTIVVNDQMSYYWETSPLQAFAWELRSDMIDLDGDGIPEGVNFDFANQPGGTGGTMYLSQIPTPTQPPRLLVGVDNHRGAVTSISYAPTTNSAVVEQHPELGKRMPGTQWVVQSTSTHDSLANTTSNAWYTYKNPQYSADDQGKYGFRGFEEAHIAVGSTMERNHTTTVQHYSYVPDWSGRLDRTTVYSAEAPADAHSIEAITWEARGLFCETSGNPFTGQNCAIVTYHPTVTEDFMCMPGQSGATCTASSAAGYTRTTSTLSACPQSGACDITAMPSPTSSMWVQTESLLQSGVAPADGDRRTVSTYELVSSLAAPDFRLRGLTTTNEVSSGGVFSMFGKSAHTWDSNFLVPLTDETWVDTNDADRSVTRREYDMTSGNVVQRWKPIQNATNGPSATYEYDLRKLFVAAAHTEPGGYYNVRNDLSFTYEYGTGARLDTLGPNIAWCSGDPPYNNPTCPAGTQYMQETRIQVDGLGRVLHRWETYAEAGQAYQLVERERNSYVDSNPASVTTSSAIDFDQSNNVRFTTGRTDLDGNGRPIRKTLFANGAAAADSVTSFTYDDHGSLVTVTMPDPSANDSSTVAYTYSFDSLGRPKTIRRPDATSKGDQSGVNVSYSGLTTTSSEYVGVAGGQAAVSSATRDAFGRLRVVAEQTSPSTWATTTYDYDAANNVISVAGPGVTTTMAHDFAGHRTQITRGTRTWAFTYDKNGNLQSETFPGSTSEVQPDPNYVTTFSYDDQDLMYGKSIGQRDLLPDDAATFGASYEWWMWGLGNNGASRLSVVYSYAPNDNFPTTTTSWVHDLEGREQYTYSQFNGLPSQSRQTNRTYNVAGSPLDYYYFDFPYSGGVDGVYSKAQYDNRGLPSSILVQPTYSSAFQTVATQTRNVAGLVTKRHTDAPSGPMTFAESNWTYDTLGRVTSQVVQEGPGPTQVARQDLAYFGADDPKSLDQWLGVSNHRHFTYGFDGRHQISSVGETLLPNAFAANYTYNDSGTFAGAQENAVALPNSDVQPRSVNYEYGGNDPEEVTALVDTGNGSRVWAYLYDTSGNQTMRCKGTIVNGACTGGDETDYVYDGNDRLRRATRKMSGALQGSEEYWYDGHGSRYIIVKRDSTGAKTETIWFIDDVEAHYDGNGNWVHSYANISMGTPVARIDTNASLTQTVEYQFHGLGDNTLAAIDQSTGMVNASFSFAPFGEIIEATDAGSSTATGITEHPRRMNDKYVDSVSSLAYYGARYYDKTSMSWTQGDPLYRLVPDAAAGNPRRGNLYSFSMNNPMRYVDPDGLDSRDWGANEFFNYNPAGSVAAAAEANEGGGFGSMPGPGNTFTSGQRLYFQSWAAADFVSFQAAAAAASADTSALGGNATKHRIRIQSFNWNFEGDHGEPDMAADSHGRGTIEKLALTGLAVVFDLEIFIPSIWGSGKDEGEAGCNVALAACVDVVQSTITRAKDIGNAGKVVSATATSIGEGEVYIGIVSKSDGMLKVMARASAASHASIAARVGALAEGGAMRAGYAAVTFGKEGGSLWVLGSHNFETFAPQWAQDIVRANFK